MSDFCETNKPKNMKKITAKFNSKCSETGKPIKKGESMYYDYSAKKCYSITSERGRFEDENKGTIWEAKDETNNDESYVAAQEDAYWDNRTGGYYSR